MLLQFSSSTMATFSWVVIHVLTLLCVVFPIVILNNVPTVATDVLCAYNNTVPVLIPAAVCEYTVYVDKAHIGRKQLLTT